MIPTLLVMGAAIGLLPRWLPVTGVLAAAVAWTVLFARDDLLSGPIDAIFVFVWGLANLAVGAFVTWLIKGFVVVLIQERDR